MCRHLTSDCLVRDTQGSKRTTEVMLTAADDPVANPPVWSRRRRLSERERRRLKEKYVEEQANYGRVCYGIRIARLERGPLVDGHYLKPN